MRIDHIFVAGYRLDLRFTQCCVASIRYWYPGIPVTLIKNESDGPYDTQDLERYWDVNTLRLDRRIFGFGTSKLEPLFLLSRERCLILDSDIVFIGRVLDSLEEHDEDFIVADTPNAPEDMKRHYFDLDRLAELDPDFVYPGYTFNAGQLVATSGLLRREDFEPYMLFSEPPVNRHPEIFASGDQGLLNYVLMKAAQTGRITLRRKGFMWWSGWLNPRRVRIRSLKETSPHSVLVHWAGPKQTLFTANRNGHLLRYFEALYYSRLPRGRIRRIEDRASRLIDVATGRLPWTKTA